MKPIVVESGDKSPHSRTLARPCELFWKERQLLECGDSSPLWRWLGFASVFALVLCVATTAPAIELRLIGVRELEQPAVPGSARVGGISGIDYDAAHDRWIAVSDAKREQGGARGYIVALDYDERALDAARVVEPVRFASADGGELVDFEAVRIDPRDGALWCASEGDAARGIEPAIYRAERWGGPMIRVALGAVIGLRPNRNFEALAFTPDGASLLLGLEAPLQQRDELPRAGVGATTTVLRIARDGRVVEELDYRLDGWQLAPAHGRLADNGLAELLVLHDGRLLALERSGAQDATGTWRFSARLYETTPTGKRLVYDFARSDQRPIGNIEGLAWGRRLANGRRTLVAVSDDNFSADAAAPGTQFWVFEVGRVSDPPSHAPHSEQGGSETRPTSNRAATNFAL